MRVALLISTYNWPEALQLVFDSILKQTRQPDQILIADDGSGVETQQVIANFSENSGLNLQHIWHEDKGFRKAEILNKAISKCTTEYIIQADGDCVLHPKFVEDHLRNARENQFLYGTRVRVRENYVPKALSARKLYFHFFSKGIKKRPRAIRQPLLNLMEKPQLKLSPKFRGCNCSFWKEDILQINGYNEDFQGWGREDSELIIRLLKKGVPGKRIKFQGIVFHLDHPENSRENLGKNDRILADIEKSNCYRVTNGIDKYL